MQRKGGRRLLRGTDKRKTVFFPRPLRQLTEIWMWGLQFGALSILQPLQNPTCTTYFPR
jgi:hypothetical protein